MLWEHIRSDYYKQSDTDVLIYFSWMKNHTLIKVFELITLRVDAPKPSKS